MIAENADLKTTAPKLVQGGARPDATNSFDALTIIRLLISHWKWLVFGPLLAGIAAYGALSVAPKRYASTTTLMISEGTARAAEFLILSPAVLDVVIAAHPDLPGESANLKRRLLAGKIRWTVTPGDVRKTASIFYMTVEDTDRERAQSVAKGLIERWLVLTKPRPDAKVRLEAELERLDARILDANVLLDRLSGETKVIVTPNSMQGELATPIERLRANRYELVQQAQTIRQTLSGGSRDTILTYPDLATEPVSGRLAPTATIAAAALILLLLGILLRYWFAATVARAGARL